MKWKNALDYATEAQKALKWAKYDTVEEYENNGGKGLNLLNSSISYLSKIGSVTDWNSKTLREEIEKITEKHFLSGSVPSM